MSSAGVPQVLNEIPTGSVFMFCILLDFNTFYTLNMPQTSEETYFLGLFTISPLIEVGEKLFKYIAI